MGRFRDRRDAGRKLAASLHPYAERDDVVVLALPRGGVPVAYEVARALRAPLDVFAVRKLGVPGHEELALGAIATGGVRYVDERLVLQLGIPPAAVEHIAEREAVELARREAAYRDGEPPLEVRDRTVIIVDDGLATGSTMRAAIASLRRRAPARIVMGTPVAAPEVCALFASIADEAVCVQTPLQLAAVGLWYEDFSQTTDDEVRALLRDARATPAHRS